MLPIFAATVLAHSQSKCFPVLGVERHYEPERLSYMLLSSVRNLEYVEPDRCYSFNPAFMTDEELEEIKEINEDIIHNALMSSVLETLNKMSNGILDRSFYDLLIY